MHVYIHACMYDVNDDMIWLDTKRPSPSCQAQVFLSSKPNIPKIGMFKYASRLGVVSNTLRLN